MSDDPQMIALEHIAWCIGQRITLDELHAALGVEAGPKFKTWQDAAARLLRIASDMELYLDARTPRQRDLPPPYRRRDPPARVCLCGNVCRRDRLPAERYCRLQSRRRVA